MSDLKAIRFESASVKSLQNRGTTAKEWIIPNLLPLGISTLCAPRNIETYQITMQLCISVCHGKAFLGHPTNKAGCLYLTSKERYSALQKNMHKVLKGDAIPENFYVGHGSDLSKNALMAGLEEELNVHPEIQVIVIEDIEKIIKLPKKSEMNYAANYSLISSLKALSDRKNISILFIHDIDVRKTAHKGSPFDLIDFSDAIVSSANTVFILQKGKKDDETAVLSVAGQDVAEKSIVIRFNKQSFRGEIVDTN